MVVGSRLWHESDRANRGNESDQSRVGSDRYASDRESYKSDRGRLRGNHGSDRMESRSGSGPKPKPPKPLGLE